MVSTPAQSSIKSSPNSEILRQRPSAPKSRTKSTLGFVSDGCFLVFHLFGELLKNRLIERNTASEALRDKIAECSFVLYKRVEEKHFYCNLPLSHVFGLRRLQGNPPRSLWLQHIYRMCCLTRRAHTAVHSNRVWVSRPYCHSERSEESSVAKCGLRLDSSALLGMTRGRM